MGLETTISRYVGTSRDDKPDDPSAGSVFLESDTGFEFVWNGNNWTVFKPFDEVPGLLKSVIAELRVLNQQAAIITKMDLETVEV